jgi:hypothetical protein
MRGAAAVFRLIAAPLLLASVVSVAAQPAHGTARMAPLEQTVSALQPLRNAPFPYRGINPETKTPFLDVSEGGRRGHTSPRGGVYWEDTTYSDNRVLLALPKGFDITRPAVLVVFLHGNNATLEADVIGRQQVLAQLTQSGLNAALIAPQLAVNAMDSSAGRFWMPKTFSRFLGEAAAHLADFYEDAPAALKRFERAPVVLVAYSGGYDPAAYALSIGGVGKRVIGVILLDGGFGEADKFVDWIENNRRHAFFFSAYSDSSAAGNSAIQAGLWNAKIDFSNVMPRALSPGVIAFVPASSAGHVDFVTNAWVDHPLAWLLARVPGFPRSTTSAAKDDR